MYLLKLTSFAVLLAFFSTSIFAADKNANPVLTAEQVAKMNCSTAAEQLREKVELTQQLGDAYLQTYQSLGDVYSIWGDRLSKLTSLSETPAIAAFFLDSGKTTKAAVVQSSKVVEDLKVETNLLMKRVVSCLP
jgi:hypothetical protein